MNEIRYEIGLTQENLQELKQYFVIIIVFAEYVDYDKVMDWFKGKAERRNREKEERWRRQEM